MTAKIEGFVFTEMEIQLMASMMGKTQLYGFGNDKRITGEILKKNTYEAIHSLAKKKYLQYVDKSKTINKVNDIAPTKFDSLYVDEAIVKLIRNITNAKVILDITKWDTMENTLIYIADDFRVKYSVGKKITIVRPNFTNKEELRVSAIQLDELWEYLLEEEYLPQNTIEGLFLGKNVISKENDKLFSFSVIDSQTLIEKKTINIYMDLTYDIDGDNRKMYSKRNIINEIEKR